MMCRVVRSSGCSLVYQSEATHQKPSISYFHETPSGSLLLRTLKSDHHSSVVLRRLTVLKQLRQNEVVPVAESPYSAHLHGEWCDVLELKSR